MSDVQTIFHGIHDGRAVWERKQDVEPILDENKRMQFEGVPQHECGRLIASIPNIVIEKWINEDGVPVLGLPADEFRKFIMQKLNSSEWRHLRTY